MDRVDSEPYLERFYMFLRDRSKEFPFNIFIHKFIKSDPDDLHDHPWGYFTLILWGGYWEHVEQWGVVTKNWRGVGYFQTVPATWRHRVELENGNPCWTLFIPNKREREWGFYKKEEGKEEWILAEKYLQDKKNKDS